MSDTNGDIERRKQRWRDFLDPAKAPQRVLLVNHDPGAPARPWPWPTNTAARIAWAWQTYEREMERLAWLHDDRVPCLAPYTGTEIFAEAFGCEVRRSNDTMPFALPRIHKASEVARLKVPQVSRTPLAVLFEIADELRRRAGAEAIVRLPDIQSPMDIAALIFDKNEFFIAVIDAPEAVAELAAKVRQVLVAFLDEWFARYGREFIAHFPYYCMPCGLTLSEDEVGSVSEDVFVEMFLPELAALSNRYGGLGVHCCADARHQWNNFKKIPNLRLINLAQPEGVLREARHFFAGCAAQMHSVGGEGPPETWPTQYPENASFVLEVAAETRDEAVALAERLRPLCGCD